MDAILRRIRKMNKAEGIILARSVESARFPHKRLWPLVSRTAVKSGIWGDNVPYVVIRHFSGHGG